MAFESIAHATSGDLQEESKGCVPVPSPLERKRAAPRRCSARPRTPRSRPMPNEQVGRCILCTTWCLTGMGVGTPGCTQACHALC